MNIFIASLSFNVTDSDLSDLFQEYGAVSSARVITDRQTGRSKGYGFVEMDDDTAANKAIAELNESELDGRQIAVSEAKPREPRSYDNNRGGYGSRSRY
ncbi:RNA-binding protein [Dysgonomonas sp. Marseille-P4361]|uniref:RNA recognition motif domain-containing protein n=1 Tax=Dysgonomonas sp. Marseille-P4361 TaxID=2161820 RepID=UPI000D561CA0|nr:RNA-binding protein [Dysgonomonas sp. Marseille-P4361]